MTDHSLRTGGGLAADLDLLNDLVARACRRGAEAADALLVNAASLSVAWRMGALEKLERSESGDIGLRVLIGRRQAIVSSSERSRQALDDLVERAVAMARTVPEDPFCGLADPADLARDLPDLDILDPDEPSAERLIALARTAEDAARAVPGINNSDGAEAGWASHGIALAGSNGLACTYTRTGSSVSVAVLAGDDSQGMERDYDYASAVHFADLRPADAIGRTAAERTLRRLGARKVATQAAPVIYAPRVARGLVSHFVAAINGAGIARGTSFLKDRMGQAVFPAGVTIVDDPLRRRGLRSRPCDAEGIGTRRMTLIEDGVLQTWLLDLRAARQLGLTTTGHATRGTSGPPGPSASNVYLTAGTVSADDLIRGVTSGFYVTELFGSGVNGVTGDYSRGATGFWIENGHLAYPVSEVTVAGNLKDMFQAITVADDLEFRYGIDCPTVRIDGMTIAGL